MSSTDAAKVEQAFVYGIPLVFNLDQVNRYVDTGVGANPAAQFNTFSHARALAGPADTFVSINNDTIYSMAQLDLSVGPITLRVPDTEGRYYVLQFVDAWTNNFAYVGDRATGTAAQSFTLVPPGWDGEIPADTRAIRVPTMIASIVGRWACAGDEDIPAVRRLQDATTLTPHDSAAVPAGIPAIDPAIDGSVQFLEKLRVWSQAFPPAAHDQAALAHWASIGVTDAGDSPYAGLSAERASELRGAVDAARQSLLTFLRDGDIPSVNGWQLAYHAFDYNIDFFEVGAIDDPRYTSMDPGQRYGLRAAAALGGLWGNHAYEAAYAAVYVDADGAQLSGEHQYTLRLDPTPPVGAFWSLTMYSVPDFFLVDNSIDRYSIGDRTPGLSYDDDGALTIVMSATPPEEPRLRANWLPAPAGAFRPLLRMYEPDPAVIDGGYEIPAIARAR